MKRIRLRLIGVPLLLLLPACAAIFQPKTAAPIEFRQYGNTENPRHICILLPGIRDRISAFEEHGFLEIAEPLLARNPDTALITVDAHWGYYRERIIEQRLNQDIVEKYPDAKLTFVGASLGGFGSLLMTMQHSERIENLVLLAPLIGEDDYVYLERIRTRGFVDLPDDEDLTLALNRVWRFLLNPQRKVKITLGYGSEDAFAPYYDYLRAQNPPLLQMNAIPGAHDWSTWRSLWEKFAGITI